jgi:hypothetical protein
MEKTILPAEEIRMVPIPAAMRGMTFDIGKAYINDDFLSKISLPEDREKQTESDTPEE